MSSDQREAYWKHQSQKHEGRSQANYGLLRSLGVNTPEEAAVVKAKLDRQDAMELELSSDKDKAVAQAIKDTQAAERATSQSTVIAARLETAAARAGVSEEQLTAALAFVDTTKFLDGNGDVDTAKVKTFVDNITPATGPTAPTPLRGPSITPHAPGGPTAVKPGDGARAALLARGIKID